MTAAILITGNTYPSRHALRAAGALFDYNEKAYIAAADNARARTAAEEAGLCVNRYDATEEQLAPATGDRLREIRQMKKDRYRDRLLARADAADQRAEKAAHRISNGEREFLALGEPIKIGHHSERRHRKLIERAWNAFEAEASEHRKADGLRRKAEGMAPARVKGDAAREHQEERDRASAAISKGDLVNTGIYGPATVTRVNKITFAVCSERTGSILKVDKAFCTLIEKRTPEAKPAPKFKKGDRVRVYPWPARADKAEYGTIRRRTPNGYSVEYTWHFRDREYTEVRTFPEASIKAAE